MFGIMHNHFVDRLRAQHSRPEVSAGDDLPELPQRPLQTDALELRDLERLLQRLAPEQREVLLLVGVEELGYQEVAQILGVPIGTVMSRLSRARARLRVEMTGGQGTGTEAAPGQETLGPAGRMQRVK
jgi:RNA polymerase sigma-70 factor (ECF subfamily)